MVQYGSSAPVKGADKNKQAKATAEAEKKPAKGGTKNKEEKENE